MKDRDLEDMLELPPVEHPVPSAYADYPAIRRESPVLIG
jgi:hypothetical protein